MIAKVHYSVPLTQTKKRDRKNKKEKASRKRKAAFLAH